MFSSFSNGVSGLQAQKVNTDIIANDIANLNTNGYKENEVNFKDINYRELNRSGMPVENAVNSGGGTAVSGAEKNFSSGTHLPTNRELDFAIDGEGFFAVELPDGELAYTRDGNFQLDSSGLLVNQNGYRVFPNIEVPEQADSIEINSEGEVTAFLKDGETVEAGQLTLHYVPNPKGMEAAGENLYKATEVSGTVSEAAPGEAGVGELNQGMLEQSNVDLANEMTEMITSQRSFQINSRIVGMSDEMWVLANEIRR